MWASNANAIKDTEKANIGRVTGPKGTLATGLLVFATERWFGGASTACRQPHAVAYVSVCDGQTKRRTYSFVLKYAGLVASFQQ